MGLGRHLLWLTAWTSFVLRGSLVLMSGSLAVAHFPLETPMSSVDRESTAAPGESRSEPNRLGGSTSPYLLLHQFNPVDWYPWGPEALARAREERKPIFLSVGYSSCYWCHVMERESFANRETAALMNELFINIKVDREERPDLDEIYMAATQIMTGQGGWPNSVFLTPDLKPFYSGTYFPPEDRYGRPGFPTVLTAVARAWRDQRPQAVRSAEAVAERLESYLEDIGEPGEIPLGAARQSLADLERRFDAEWGGFAGAPKFPTPANLLLLLEMAETDPTAREMLHTTLDEMARGGLYDQVGGGFHRYATDREWKVPHFEKMLYDNGLLLEIYARAYELDPDPEWHRIAVETVEFLVREMLDETGGFWSAIDAETNAHEGAFYVWTREELDRALGAEDSARLAPILGFDGEPFFEGTHYVLHLPRTLEEYAAAHSTTRKKLLAEIGPLRKALLAARSSRERPLTDDKILADWNGLAIAGLAEAGRVFDDGEMIARAEAAARFVLDTLWSRVGEDRNPLRHAYRDGAAKIDAFLADYAYLTHGLLALHRATGKSEWLEAAVQLVAEQSVRLGAPQGGFFVAAESDDVLFRSRDPYDGAVPSANGVAVWNLLELARRTGKTEYREEAERSLRAFGPTIARAPEALRSLSLAAQRFQGGVPESPSERPTGEEPSRGAAAELAESVVTARLRSGDTEGSFVVELQIQAGWHINANPASLEYLIPTSLVGKSGESLDVEYPRGESFRFSFAEDEIDVYQDSLRLTGRWPDAARGGGLRLTYQPCDDTRCLPPVTRELDLK